MAAPLITAITTVPNRENATNQASFSNDVDTFFSQVDGFQTQANAQAQYLDGVAAEVDASEAAAAASALEASGYASTTIDARDAAIASAVYKGTWEGKTSAGVIGESYSYQGSYIYRLNVNLANISTSVPSPTNTDWQLINVVPFEAPCKATLDLDFANQDFTIYDKQGGFVKRPLADIVSQGRATAGTSTDAIGGVTEFAAGENRFTFDGETGEALGYLSEESRTNLLTNSEFPNGLSDLQTTGNVSLSQIDLGNGLVNAIQVERVAGQTSIAYKRGFSFTVGTAYCVSVFVEMDDGLPPVFNRSNIQSPENDFIVALAGNSGTGDYLVSRFFGNVYRVTSFVTPTATTDICGVFKYSTNSPRTFKVTGYQLEVGSFPTSYIRTLGSPVTRGSDSMTRTLGQEWNPKNYTIVIKRAVIDGCTNPRLISLKGSGGLTQNGLAIFSETSATTLKLTVFSGGSSILGGVDTGISKFSKSVAIAKNGELLTIANEDGQVFTVTYTESVDYTEIDFDRQSASSGTNHALHKFTLYPRAFDSLTLQRLSRIQ